MSPLRARVGGVIKRKVFLASEASQSVACKVFFFV